MRVPKCSLVDGGGKQVSKCLIPNNDHIRRVLLVPMYTFYICLDVPPTITGHLVYHIDGRILLYHRQSLSVGLVDSNAFVCKLNRPRNFIIQRWRTRRDYDRGSTSAQNGWVLTTSSFWAPSSRTPLPRDIQTPFQCFIRSHRIIIVVLR